MAASSAPIIEARAATLADIPLLLHWQSQPHVVAAGAGGDWQWERELGRPTAGHETLIFEIDGRPLGMVHIVDPARDPEQYWGAVADNPRALDIFIGEAADLGRGYGAEMMRQALARCFADPAVSGVLIDPLAVNRRAIRFYRRLGFEYVETRRFDDDLCDVHCLSRKRWLARRRPGPG